jgi:hypothetical protein
MGGVEVVEVLDVPAAYLTKFGLGSPTTRFITLAVVVGGVSYMLKMPASAFRKDGTSKPLNMLSYDPDSVSVFNHFLTLPLIGSFLFVAFLT